MSCLMPNASSAIGISTTAAKARSMRVRKLTAELSSVVVVVGGWCAYSQSQPDHAVGWYHYVVDTVLGLSAALIAWTVASVTALRLRSTESLSATSIRT